MPGVAENAMPEPDHELTVVQQVQGGSISSTGSQALLTVKLPGTFGTKRAAKVVKTHHCISKLLQHWQRSSRSSRSLLSQRPPSYA
jgi:hypothetical protein